LSAQRSRCSAGRSTPTASTLWANPTRDSLQSYLDFSNRWNVPLLIGETGELTNAWNEKFRLLHERFGIGWCFWPYKNLDSDSAVVSIAKPAGWDLIASVGSADVPLSPRLGRLTLSLSQGRETHSNNA
jgi:endoglucanase